jgi:hypothetical protein
MLLAALALAGQRGWCVFPLNRETKVPHIKGWPDRATDDEDQVAGWWRKWRGANIGVATGGKSGVLVVDVDGATGRASLVALEAEHGALPSTYRVSTGRKDGGEHFYFAIPHSAQVSTRGGLWPGIDIMGDGGQAVGAGSLHRSGRRYAATDPTAPVAPAPDWLLTAIERPAGGPVPTTRSVGVPVADYVAEAVAGEVRKLAATGAGGRNDQLNRSACALGHYVGSGQADADEVSAALLSTAQEMGLSESEATATIRSGLKKGASEPVRLVSTTTAASEEGGLEAEIAKEEHRIVVREEARRRVLARKADEGFRPLQRRSLKEALARDRPAEPPTLIFGLHRQGYNTTITARYKTGKTTLGANLLRALADGDPFLDRFSVAPPAGRIGLLNYETTEHDMLEWLESSGIQNTDRIAVENLRGHPFSLAAERNRQELMAWCREMAIEVLLLDPHRMAFSGFGKEIDNDDVNRFTATLDEVKAEAGVSDLFLFVHTGRGEAEDGAEHARGATALDDWADQRWVLAKSREPNDDTRYFYADGRLPYVPEFALEFDPATRRLSAGEGNRRGQGSDRQLQEVLNVLEAAGAAGANTSELKRVGGISKRQETAFTALLKRAAAAGQLSRSVGGKGKETRYWLPAHAPEGQS